MLVSENNEHAIRQRLLINLLRCKVNPPSLDPRFLLRMKIYGNPLCSRVWVELALREKILGKMSESTREHKRRRVGLGSGTLGVIVQKQKKNTSAVKLGYIREFIWSWTGPAHLTGIELSF